MIDLVEGGFAGAGDDTGEVHISEEVSKMRREVQDDHVYSGAHEVLFRFQHMEWIKSIGVEAKGEAHFALSTMEEALSIDVPEVPEYGSVPDVLHDRSFGFVTRFS